jgi:drug/metabolite transporter (DMT)-like permease
MGTSSRAVGLASGLVAVVVIGSSVPVSAGLLDYPPLAAQGERYVVAGLLLMALARLSGARLTRPRGREWLRVAAMAATGMAGFNLCLFAALDRADPSAVAVVIGIMPVVVAVAAPLVRGERPAASLVGAAAIAVAGAAIVEGTGTASLVGLLAAGGAMVGEATFTIILGPLVDRIGAWSAASWACLTAAGLVGVAHLVVSGGVPAPTTGELSALVYMAAVVTAVGFVAFFTAVKRLGAETAGLLSGLIPVAALLVSAALGRDELTAPKVLGVGLVGAAVTVGVRLTRTSKLLESVEVDAGDQRVAAAPLGARPSSCELAAS